MRVLLVEPGKAPRGADIGDGLEAMKTVVGGLIQAVYPFEEPVALVCSDEGKLLGLPPNRALRDPETGIPYDVVAGTFFLCAAPPDSESFGSLSEEQIARYADDFRRPELSTEAEA